MGAPNQGFEGRLARRADRHTDRTVHTSTPHIRALICFRPANIHKSCWQYRDLSAGFCSFSLSPPCFGRLSARAEAMRLLRIATLLLLLGWQALQANADEQQIVQHDDIRVGVIQDKSPHDYCGAHLQFSKDFREHNGKYAFLFAYTADRKTLMNLDGHDVSLQLTSWTIKETIDREIISEQLSLKNKDYRVEIKWLFTDICDEKHNEDCEIEGLRAHLKIYRYNRADDGSLNCTSVRHLRLLGLKGC